MNRERTERNAAFELERKSSHEQKESAVRSRDEAAKTLKNLKPKHHKVSNWSCPYENITRSRKEV